MAQTKIEQLKTINAKLINDVERLDVEVRDGMNLISELQDEIGQCTGMNDRLNASLKKELTKIGDLKSVARFYRAQRDRVDAYLSATLDSIRPSGFGAIDPFATQDRVETRNLVAPEPPSPESNRPRINEPFVSSYGDGRFHASYRDDEPGKDWESY